MNKGYLKLSEAEEPHCFASHDAVRKEKPSKATVALLAITTILQARNQQINLLNRDYQLFLNLVHQRLCGLLDGHRILFLSDCFDSADDHHQYLSGWSQSLRRMKDSYA
jgi:hypothetical protein